MLNGSARVLLRSANDSVDRDDVASSDINGDGSAIGCTPTASTMPTNTSSAAYRALAPTCQRDPGKAAQQQREPDDDDAAGLM